MKVYGCEAYNYNLNFSKPLPNLKSLLVVNNVSYTISKINFIYFNTLMDFKPPKKTRKLDFTRPTFNEPIIQLPPLKEENSK